MDTDHNTGLEMVNQLKAEQMLRRYAYRTGTFTLSSGASATEYLDVKSALLHPEAGRAIALALADECQAVVGQCRAAVRAIAGVIVGGALAAVRVADLLRVPTVAVRTAPRAHGTKTCVEGLTNVAEGGPVILIEDVITSGASVTAALDRIAQESPALTVVAVVAVVDRQAGGVERVRAAGVNIVASVTTLARVRAVNL